MSIDATYLIAIVHRSEDLSRYQPEILAAQQNADAAHVVIIDYLTWYDARTRNIDVDKAAIQAALSDVTISQIEFPSQIVGIFVDPETELGSDFVQRYVIAQAERHGRPVFRPTAVTRAA